MRPAAEHPREIRTIKRRVPFMGGKRKHQLARTVAVPFISYPGLETMEFQELYTSRPQQREGKQLYFVSDRW